MKHSLNASKTLAGVARPYEAVFLPTTAHRSSVRSSPGHREDEDAPGWIRGQLERDGSARQTQGRGYPNVYTTPKIIASLDATIVLADALGHKWDGGGSHCECDH